MAEWNCARIVNSGACDCAPVAKSPRPQRAKIAPWVARSRFAMDRRRTP